MKKHDDFHFNADNLVSNDELSKLKGGVYAVFNCSASCVSGPITFSSTCGGWDSWCAEEQSVGYYSQLFPGCSCNCSPSVQM
jgi:hypothetical protein